MQENGLSESPAAAETPQETVGVEQRRIVDTVRAVFAAALTDDLEKFNAVVVPGFYIFEAGARFDGKAIMALIKAQHEAGNRFEWNVTEPDVHVSGTMAWVAYVNVGSITDGTGTTARKWLESACLEKQAGLWKIVFMHSTRVPPA